MTAARELFDPLWKFWEQKLRTAGVSALDYAQLVTYLLFLKLDHERSRRPGNFAVRVVSEGLDWPSLTSKSGDDLERQFGKVLQECGKKDPDPRMRIKRTVFRKAELPIHNPALLAALITDQIGSRTWRSIPSESLRGMYALLMEKAAADFQIGSGQTLTPLALGSAVIDCLRPTEEDTVLDPACGTGSLLVAAYRAMETAGVSFPREAISGVEWAPEMCRFATMNLLLARGMRFDEPPPVQELDALASPSSGRPTVVVCNPPFTSTAPVPDGRSDFIVNTSSYQLSFLQHIVLSLPIGGRAAVVVPDNILFGSGGDLSVRKWLLQQCDVHTLLRLPTNIFARGGVKTNVLFFTKAAPRNDSAPATKEVWIYDFRTGQNFKAKQNPLKREHLDEFVALYRAEQREQTERFRVFSHADLLERDLNLDITWPTGEADELLSPKRIAQEIADELTVAAELFASLAASLPDDASDQGDEQ
ncbi:class I SAM-dependent DNA methyltransferase [Microbispora rosea]|uniref:class I SAM-dependent DNA methyltransferase n=1 Tax=Microbispora rosea TaxID=58117 RepID=UPI00379D6D7A